MKFIYFFLILFVFSFVVGCDHASDDKPNNQSLKSNSMQDRRDNTDTKTLEGYKNTLIPDPSLKRVIVINKNDDKEISIINIEEKKIEISNAQQESQENIKDLMKEYESERLLGGKAEVSAEMTEQMKKYKQKSLEKFLLENKK